MKPSIARTFKKQQIIYRRLILQYYEYNNQNAEISFYSISIAGR
ncbi:hypothetical protein BIFBRE_03147 [Bifidobacterium breve DSM 20213 = JCM 1192]|uniref:Uncharacterized protein n=1 Tax=Bifidobacterium breve DSM 20213 = JCM 1192 TaxID=518634 RepID=D4BM55_BIFBR|nr:hypothetical protein BIFBRE_03147 [Bifidobacterium breve DSM 20213 = JCM 1192]